MQLSKSHFGMSVCDIFSEQLLKRTPAKCNDSSLIEGIEIWYRGGIEIYPQFIFPDAGTWHPETDAWTPGSCRPDTWHLEPDTWDLAPAF